MKKHVFTDGHARSFPTDNCSICQREGTDFNALQESKMNLLLTENPSER